MNMCYRVNMTWGIQAPLDTLRALPGLKVRATDEYASSRHRVDALVSIISERAAADYVAEFRQGVTTTTLPHIITRLEAYRRDLQQPPLLLAPYLTPAVTKRLLDERIEFADAAGNVYLDGPAAYVLITGQKRRGEPVDTGFTATDLVLIFALLARPELRQATYRELNLRTGVSLGKISATINQLQALGHLRRAKSGVLILRDPEVLVERWEFGYLEQLRPSLHPMGWRIGPDARLSGLRTHAEVLEGVLIGGEHAANDLTKNLTPATLTLHVPKGQAKNVAAELRLARGGDPPDVQTLERFAPVQDMRSSTGIDVRPNNGRPKIADPILVRAELLALDDPRLRHVADQLLAQTVLPNLRHGVD